MFAALTDTYSGGGDVMMTSLVMTSSHGLVGSDASMITRARESDMFITDIGCFLIKYTQYLKAGDSRICMKAMTDDVFTLHDIG